MTVNTATLTAVGAAAASPMPAGNTVRLTGHTAVQMATATPPPMTIELGNHSTATRSLPLTTIGPLTAATASSITGHTVTGHTVTGHTAATQIATATPPITVELGNHNTASLPMTATSLPMTATSLPMTATSLPITAAEAETEPLTGQTVRLLSGSGGSQLSGGGTLLLNHGSTLKVNGRLLTGLPATAAVGTTAAVSTKVTLSPLARAQPTLPSLNR